MSLFELVGALTTVIAVFGYINYRFIRLPDAVGITAMGLAASVLLTVAGRIEVVLMGLVIGNHGSRSAMSATTREHLFSFWELLDAILKHLGLC